MGLYAQLVGMVPKQHQFKSLENPGELHPFPIRTGDSCVAVFTVTDPCSCHSDKELFLICFHCQNLEQFLMLN